MKLTIADLVKANVLQGVEKPKKLQQTKFGVPEGNCFATCLAMLLNMAIEDVPNYKEGEGEWYQNYRKWLLPLGYDFMAVQGWDKESKPFQPKVFSIVSGKSPRGDFDHSVIYFGSEIYHDPHPDGTGIETIKDCIYLLPIDTLYSQELDLGKLFDVEKVKEIISINSDGCGQVDTDILAEAICDKAAELVKEEK